MPNRLKKFWIGLRDEWPGLIIMTPLIFIYGILISVALSSVYKPIRLYYTGVSTELNLESKKRHITVGRNGPTFHGYYAKLTGLENELPIDKDDLYFSLKTGEKTNVFYSQKINFGIVTNRERLSLLACISNYNGTGSLLIFVVGIATIIYILFYGLFLIINAWIAKNSKQIDLALYSDRTITRISAFIKLGKDSLPDLILISLSYFITLISVKLILQYENGDDITSGLIIFLSILSLFLIPFLFITTRHFFSTKKILLDLVGVVKIAVGIYTSVKTLRFFQIKEFQGENSGIDIILDLLKYIFSF